VTRISLNYKLRADPDWRFVLPDFPATTKWLTPEEREYAVRRLEQDDNSSRAGDISHWQSFTSALRDWRTWLFFWAQTFCTCAGTITYFIPTLMAALNYTGQSVQYVRSFEFLPFDLY
jgi:hypothetical protein